MPYVSVWYWEYSLVFPITLIVVLFVYFCCRIICMKQVENDRTQNRQNRRNRQNQQAGNQSGNVSQVYTITAVVVPDQGHPPRYKQPNTVDDLPPSYDEALVLADGSKVNTKAQEPVSPTT